ncbi:hypothetical protein ACEV6Q_04040 [Enterobacter ludwigii]|uniref:hypothetical protein n=1 Tax=Enterobacter ludwigii TaxID=299767 RepID=UPI003BEECC99
MGYMPESIDVDFYEERLNISTGYFDSGAIERLSLMDVTRRKYEVARYYVCMSMGNFWQEIRFQCKPTRKQISRIVKEFKLYCKELKAEIAASDEYGRIHDR